MYQYFNMFFSLINLEISGCIHFSTNCIFNIGVYCRNLNSLNISNCHRVKIKNKNKNKINKKKLLLLLLLLQTKR